MQNNSTEWANGSDTTASVDPILIKMRLMNSWMLPIIISVGLVGNVFSVFIIWRSSALKRVSSNHYLVALAISDSLFLFSLFMMFLNRLGAATYHNNAVMCKMVLFLLNSSSCLSSWYITTLTIERFVVVYYPLYRNAICSIGRTRRIIVALVPWPPLFNVHTLITSGLNELGLCDSLQEYYAVSLVINSVDTAVSFVIPVTAILAFNTAICIRLWSGSKSTFGARPRSKGRKEPKASVDKTNGDRCNDKKVSYQPLRGDAATTSPSQTQSPKKSVQQDDAESTSMRKHAGANAKIQRQERKITKTLLIISFVFVALNLPSYSVRLHDYILAARGVASANTSVGKQIMANVFLIIYYLNFASNFVVYCVSSKNFRAAVRGVWTRSQTGTAATASTVFTGIRPSADGNLAGQNGAARTVGIQSTPVGAPEKNGRSEKGLTDDVAEGIVKVGGNGRATEITNGSSPEFNIKNIETTLTVL